MTRNGWRKPQNLHRSANSRPFGVSAPLNSRAKRNIRGLEDHSDAKQRTPNTPVGTEPLSSSRRALPVASPMTDATAIPTSTTAPMASRRLLRAAAMATPKAGNTPLITSAVAALDPDERSNE